MDRIAAAADVARATFFNHFPSKHALLREMAEAMNERFHRALAAECERDVSTAERLEHFFLVSAERVERTERLTRDLFLEAMRLAPGGAERGREMAAIQASFGALIRDGQRRGDVRTDEDADFLAEMVAGAFSALFLNWLCDETYALRDRARRTARFLGSAIAPSGPDEGGSTT